MAKFIAFIAFFAMALLIADAYSTTITTVEIDDENQGSKERCREMGGYQQLRSCEQYLRQRGRPGVLLRREIDNNKKQQVAECCRELKQVDEQCRCDKLEEIVGKQQGTQQMQEKARNLPAMCGLRPQRCYF